MDKYYNLSDLLNGLFGSNYMGQRFDRRPAPPPPAPQRDLASEIAERKARIAAEQKELEEAERLLESQKNKIRYVADDEKIEMLIPREKIVKMISNLTKAINDNPDAKTYKLTINL